MPPLISLVESYDQYFASRLYEQRYPRPNPSTFAVVVGEIDAQGQRVLDVGCGNGRYAESLLERSNAKIVACDVSREAIDEISSRCAKHIACGRLRAIHGDLSLVAKSIEHGEKFDLAIMLFGVLGHIYSRALRRETLATIRDLLRPGGRLVLTVPNAARRFAKQQAAARALVQAGHLEAGDILYERTADKIVMKMYYHLYTLEELVDDLEQQGFQLIQLAAESFLPESGVVKSSLLRGLDRILTAALSLRYAYGFLAVAEVASDSEQSTLAAHALAPPPAAQVG
ncbi:class I SAM-dependent methyltransferase [Candidatus Accumulibacter sp. ACC003]|uniref:class I SAM-dependent methyltransferase n=1 Tax=Candidatus Accumulibacter sp. ACC003 TaxID=2823334 RepID=UPI0025C7260B|nr:class I SAM-dependent methyltransferase [Candidatus Accumulibacter sp. ACC003]